MRRLSVTPFLTALLLLAGFSASGQQLPVRGCEGAISCSGPRGFKTALDQAGHGNLFLSVGVRYEDGLRARIVSPRADIPDFRAIDAAVSTFLAQHPPPRRSRRPQSRRVPRSSDRSSPARPENAPS